MMVGIHRAVAQWRYLVTELKGYGAIARYFSKDRALRRIWM
jgi:hypothetical protein